MPEVQPHIHHSDNSASVSIMRFLCASYHRPFGHILLERGHGIFNVHSDVSAWHEDTVKLHQRGLASTESTLKLTQAGFEPAPCDYSPARDQRATNLSLPHPHLRENHYRRQH